ncbi:hypothetical protein [uncultured Dokdonia sp.]|uniref:hypothetical protein n=1 Tax=uncultured Dokdonia sp. TaxID=575653 RepID=UPI002622AD29|nr:hypothetical protein [uncultured Dokdonia sp.]
MLKKRDSFNYLFDMRLTDFTKSCLTKKLYLKTYKLTYSKKIFSIYAFAKAYSENIPYSRNLHDAF